MIGSKHLLQAVLQKLLGAPNSVDWGVASTRPRRRVLGEYLRCALESEVRVLADSKAELADFYNTVNRRALKQREDDDVVVVVAGDEGDSGYGGGDGSGYGDEEEDDI
ncbi:hypothetical protein QVD17_00307 [Tagetes erecta]|uniref:Uncharacterized protein n=1 Tax=Tagetes erecta TaxID=13708 RepID=A0AAD8LBC4_TARER|nr:hypothetical protein QVD17_00307 [Tagetes erecta]